MENGYMYCDLWELVQGKEKDDGSAEWKKKDTSVKSFLYQSISDPLLAKIQHCSTTADAWSIFASQYGQIGMGSVIIWMHTIVKPLGDDQDVPKHLVSFGEALCNLDNFK